jgi:hypothetical protein
MSDEKRSNRRARKRLRQEQALAEYWYVDVGENALRDGPWEDLGVSPIEVHMSGPLNPGDMEGSGAWLVFNTKAEAKDASRPTAAAALECRARELLAASEYPAQAVPEFWLKFTSRPEIEHYGGEFAFFHDH